MSKNSFILALLFVTFAVEVYYGICYLFIPFTLNVILSYIYFY